MSKRNLEYWSKAYPDAVKYKLKTARRLKYSEVIQMMDKQQAAALFIGISSTSTTIISSVEAKKKGVEHCLES